MEERKKQEEDINKENEPESIAKTDENESRLESNNITKLDEDVNSKDNKEGIISQIENILYLVMNLIRFLRLLLT